MINNIKELPKEVVAKIAAGEVIDRPDAVVKELIENSLDAGAKTIEIYLEKAGMKRIEVRDDGHGMNKNDLQKSFLPHTTSKLKTAEDLESIMTFGFRGEALSSMVAVAKVTLESRQKKDSLGYSLVVKNGKILTENPDGMPIGTRIIIESLFSGIPARKKFINKVQRELQYILKRVTSFALAQHDVQFKVFHDGKKLFEVFKQSSLKNRAKEVLGKSFSEQSLLYEFDQENIKVTGLLGKPQLSLRSPSRQYIFINGRPIRNRQIAKAIRDAYGALLEPKAYPSFIIFITLPSHFCDANIHPRKEEVLLFHDNIFIKNLYEDIHKFLLEKDLTYIL